MKLVKITVLPLAAALILVGVLLATKDYSTTETQFFSLGYTISWGSRSFDEAVWLAVEAIAVIEENLPEEVDNFRVAVLPTDSAYSVVYVDFNRAGLRQLKAGQVAPEIFIREYVSFH
ncbi:MAG: hypothetical protein ACETWG_04355 [Candidatus Neomarinimicrobiota bacterium]